MNVREIIANKNLKELYELLSKKVVPFYLVKEIRKLIEETDIVNATEDEKKLFHLILERISKLNKIYHKNKSRGNFSLFAPNNVPLNKMTEIAVNPMNELVLLNAIAKFLDKNERNKFRFINKAWARAIDNFDKNKKYFIPRKVDQLIIESEGLKTEGVIKLVAAVPDSEAIQIAAIVRARRTENLQVRSSALHQRAIMTTLYTFGFWVSASILIVSSISYHNATHDISPTARSDMSTLFNMFDMSIGSVLYFVFRSLQELEILSPSFTQAVLNLFDFEKLFFLMIICSFGLTLFLIASDLLSNTAMHIPGWFAERNVNRFFREARELDSQNQSEENTLRH
jgi:hypothetical protein